MSCTRSYAVVSTALANEGVQRSGHAVAEPELAVRRVLAALRRQRAVLKNGVDAVQFAEPMEKKIDEMDARIMHHAAAREFALQWAANDFNRPAKGPAVVKGMDGNHSGPIRFSAMTFFSTRLRSE